MLINQDSLEANVQMFADTEPLKQVCWSETVQTIHSWSQPTAQLTTEESADSGLLTAATQSQFATMFVDAATCFCVMESASQGV